MSVNIFGCLFFHKWEYEPVREAEYTVQLMLGRVHPILIDKPRDEIQQRQFRTCTRCKITQDTRVQEYSL